MSGASRHNGSSPGDREPTLDVLPDARAAASAAATLIAGALAEAVRLRGRADWATTGGSTPVPIYGHLARPPLRDHVPWDRVHVWWGDDRLVPRADPLSNCLAFDEGLLGAGVPLPLENVHRMPCEIAIAAGSPEGPDRAAAAYEAELRAAPLARDARGFPVLDVVLVGVGPDGHVLSVFPGSPLFESTAWVAAVPAPAHVAPHVGRLSLNPAILLAARLPIVVIIGGAKADIVAEVLGPVRDVRRWPAQAARRAGAIWFLDAAAAARLGPAGAPG
jgi:6-phosphogluconolactonase